MKIKIANNKTVKMIIKGFCFGLTATITTAGIMYVSERLGEKRYITDLKSPNKCIDQIPENMYYESTMKYDGYYLDGDRLVAIKSPIEGLSYKSESKIILNGVTYLAPENYVLRIEEDGNVVAILSEYAELEGTGRIVTYDTPEYPGYTTIEVNGEPRKAINNYKVKPIIEEEKNKELTLTPKIAIN